MMAPRWSRGFQKLREAGSFTQGGPAGHGGAGAVRWRAGVRGGCSGHEPLLGSPELAFQASDKTFFNSPVDFKLIFFNF